MSTPPSDIEEPQRRKVVARRTVLIALATLLIAAGLTGVLVLAQRMYADPWRVGAIDVGRISADPSQKVPGVFAGPDVHPDAQAYMRFHGLAAVVYTQKVQGGATSRCLVIYRLSDLASSEVTDPSGNSFTGLYLRGCSAGTFPAVAQFNLRDTELPPELRATFPSRTAIQFVYDGSNNEIHVFVE